MHLCGGIKERIQLINIMIYTRTYPTKTTCIHAEQIIRQQQQQQQNENYNILYKKYANN